MLVRSSNVRSSSILPTSLRIVVCASEKWRNYNRRFRRSALRIEHSQIKHSIDADLHIVASDADLLWNIYSDFLEAVPITNNINERDE